MYQNMSQVNTNATFIAISVVVFVSFSLTKKYYPSYINGFRARKTVNLKIITLLLISAIFLLPLATALLISSHITPEYIVVFLGEFLLSVTFVLSFFITWKILGFVITTMGDVFKKYHIKTYLSTDEVQNQIKTNYPLPLITNLYIVLFSGIWLTISNRIKSILFDRN